MPVRSPVEVRAWSGVPKTADMTSHRTNTKPFAAITTVFYPSIENVARGVTITA